MNEPVIVTTPAQLQSIISDAVNAILPKLADFRRKNEPVQTDGMNVEDAALFLTEQGIPTTRATLYNQVYKNTIPYRKFGRRTVFSKKELLAWIESMPVSSTQRQPRLFTLTNIRTIRGVSIRSASFLCSKGARNYLPQTSPLHFMYQILAAISGTSGQKA